MKKIYLLSAALVLVASFAIFLSQNNSNLKNFVLGTSTGLADSPWPMYHGGPQHGGQSSVDTSHVDGTLLWTFEVDGNAEAPPTIGADGTIYMGSHSNTLYAINPDGTEKWKFNVGKPVYSPEFGDSKGILSAPAIARDGTIYFSSILDYFIALNPDGTEKWRVDLPFSADVWTSPAIGPDGTIYTGSARAFDKGISSKKVGGLYAFNPDGTSKWEMAFGTDMGSSPAIADDGTVYGSTYSPSRGWLVAANPDGTEKWRFGFSGFTESSPAIGADGTVYFGTEPGMVYAVNPDGTEKWGVQTGDGVSATPAIGKDGTVYVGSWDSYFYAINPDGTEKWKVKTPDAFEALSSSPAIGAEGTIYVGSGQPSMDNDNFFAFNPDGTVKWSYATKGGISSSTAIGTDGTVYVAAHNGGLYAFGGPEKASVPEGIKQALPESISSKSFPTSVFVIGFVTVLIIGGLIVLLKKNKINKKWLVLIPLLILIIAIAFLVLNSLKGGKGGGFSKVGSKVFDKFTPKKSKINTENICLMEGGFENEDKSNTPVLTIPFDIEDYSTKHWGIIPFCAKLKHSDQVHSAFDFELKPNSKVYSSTDGVVEDTYVGDAEGSGEIISVKGEGFTLGYSGLTNVQVKAGDTIKTGDYIANTVATPYGEHHVHLGISIDGNEECPLKYMDEEFLEAFKQMFAAADYQQHSDAPCACNCESMTPSY